MRIQINPNKEQIVCLDCRNLSIVCKCDDGDGWCPGCPLCEPMGLAHRIDGTDVLAQKGQTIEVDG